MRLRENPILEKKKYEQKLLFEPKFEYTVKRSPKQQEVKFARTEAAAESIGKMEKNIERYILSKGQFSLIEFIDSMLEQIGPSHLIISTWTANGRDISDAFEFLHNKRILSCRFLVDFTFYRREPAFCGQMRKLFGDEAIRVTRNHAKMAIMHNADWSVNVFTSANLNMNPRMEYFLIRESEELLRFNLEWIDHLFRTKKVEENNVQEAKWHKAKFKVE